MRNRIARTAWSALAVATAGLGVLSASPGAAAPSGVTQPVPRWDSGYDFRGAPYSTNPQRDAYGNRAVWTYLWAPSTAGTPDRATFVRMTDLSSAEGGVEGNNAWYGPDPSGPSRLPFVDYVATGSPLRIGPTLVDPPGELVLHPSREHSAVLAWDSPWTGEACLRWTVGDDDPGGGDGVFVHVLVRGEQVWGDTVENGAPLRTTGRRVHVRQGQHVDVVVDPDPAGGPGDNGWDSTYVDLTVTACAGQ